MKTSANADGGGPSSDLATILCFKPHVDLVTYISSPTCITHMCI